MHDVINTMKPITRKDMGLPAEEKFYEINGKSKTMAEWARVSGIPHKTLSTRLQRGLSMKEAISRPYVSRGRGAM